MVNYRQYRRDLNPQQYKNLSKEYEFHLKRSRGGFLTTQARERFLKIRKGEKSYNEAERQDAEADFWYRLKNSARDAIVDLRLICDISSEDVLKDIFAAKDERNRFFQLQVFLRKLFPPNTGSITKEDEWRNEITEKIVCDGLVSYVNSGVLSSESHRRAVFEVLDAISLVSTGRKKYKRNQDGGIEEVSQI